MAIQTTCTGCGKILAVGDEHAGKRARCPACGSIYTVPAAATSPDQPSPPDSSLGGLGSPDQPDESSGFWMQSTAGQVFGPADRQTLNRWFSEGRVGAGYRIRVGLQGDWFDAALFHQAASAPGGAVGTAAGSANPYAASPSSPWSGTATSAPSLHRYPKPDRGVLVLVMGILSFAICGVFGIAAVIMGRTALNDIQSGRANPKDKTMVQVGFWLGVVNLILHVLAIIFYIIIFAVAISGQNFAQ